MFLSVYGVLSIIYLILYYGHNMLYRINSSLVEEEEEIKDGLQYEFLSYTRDINPELLFEGLENTIVALRNKEVELVDEMVDHLSFLYRYILARRDKELVSIKAELEAIDHLIKLNNHFPYRHVQLETSIKNEFLIIPSSMISIIDHFIRCCIPAKHPATHLSIMEMEDEIQIKLDFIGSIKSDTQALVDYWMSRFQAFTNLKWYLKEDEYQILLKIPALTCAENGSLKFIS